MLWLMDLFHQWLPLEGGLDKGALYHQPYTYSLVKHYRVG
jgi:hypothetical protein